MKTKKDRAEVPVEESSGNIFADLELPGAEDLRLKAELTRQLCNRIRTLDLSQVQAARRLRLKQPDVSKLMNGRHTGFSADRLIALLNALEVDVDIVLRPQRKTTGQRGTIRVMEAAV